MNIMYHLLEEILIIMITIQKQVVTQIKSNKELLFFLGDKPLA